MSQPPMYIGTTPVPGEPTGEEATYRARLALEELGKQTPEQRVDYLARLLQARFRHGHWHGRQRCPRCGRHGVCLDAEACAEAIAKRASDE